jgi:hypothetical protein
VIQVFSIEPHVPNEQAGATRDPPCFGTDNTDEPVAGMGVGEAEPQVWHCFAARGQMDFGDSWRVGWVRLGDFETGCHCVASGAWLAARPEAGQFTGGGIRIIRFYHIGAALLSRRAADMTARTLTTGIPSMEFRACPNRVGIS